MGFLDRDYNPEYIKLLNEVAKGAYERSSDDTNPNVMLSHAISMATDAKLAHLKGLISKDDLEKIDMCVKHLLKRKGYL